eukprot:jgi/Tetstr1/425773/TSEL_001558.t1
MVEAEDADELLAKVLEFEKVADPSDKEQAQLLKQMKEHACRIKYSRGDWNKLSHFRSWNMFREKQPKPPMEIESLRVYKEHRRIETVEHARVQAPEAPRLLEQ